MDDRYTLDLLSSHGAQSRIRIKWLAGAFAAITVIAVVLVIAAFTLVVKDRENLDRLEKNTSGVSARLDNLEKSTVDILARLGQLEIRKAENRLLATNWYKGSDGVFYKKFTERVNYEKAISRCANYNGVVFSKGARNLTMQKELEQAGVLVPNQEIWIGYDDILEENVWVWLDDETANTTAVQWSPNEPDDWYDGEDCAQIRFLRESHVEINDLRCNSARPFICEVELTPLTSK